MAGANSVKTILYALWANSAIAVAKLGAAVVTGSSAMVIGESINIQKRERMRTFIASRQEVVSILDMISMQFGKDAMVSLKPQLSPGDGDNGLVKDINAFESDFKHAFPEVVCLFVEPDIAD
ncbi:MAG TPA: hypothetical protein VJ902_01910 [Wenzhouxiangellaceae bacterium]|nr:hypothetical protein [Wenzhouxiangellaceae bacterium]